jgi:hypothetical protein
MPDPVRRILSRLEPVSDKVVRRPLAEEEIQALEASVDMPLPACVRDYFRTIGFFQDLTAYGTADYEVFDRFDQFRKQRDYLAANFDKSAVNLFPFADDGAGNVIAVAKGTEDDTLFFADHETHELRRIGSFCDWLSSVVDAALKNERPANAEKKWCVQFSFRVSDPEPILTVMRQFGAVSAGEWSESKTLPSKVNSSEAPLDFANEQLILKRSQYHAWEQPMFTFDYSEPVDLPPSASVIRKLDAGFQRAGWAYKLVDYGPLSLEWGKPKSADQTTKRPWAKIWSRLTSPL